MTLSDGTIKEFGAEGDAYVITPGGVLEIDASQDGRQFRQHFSPSGWSSVIEFEQKPGKKPKRALVLR